ncbi:MAG: InlB B-repeat-containing protein [archaeon]|nr:InlB B-repeat-containing protein [archaeon]
MAASAESSEAATLPTINVCSSVTGQPISGAILDDCSLDINTNTDSDGKVWYILPSGLTLVSGSTYAIATGSDSYNYALYANIIGHNDYFEKTGFRLSFYQDRSCTGTPDFTTDLKPNQYNLVTSIMQKDVRYYIQVEVLSNAMFDSLPDIKGIGFSFTIDSGRDTNAVYFEDDGNIIDQRLFRNGDRYELPQLRDDGRIFLGWYTKDNVHITQNDTVRLISDTTLYARWWNGTDDEEIEETTPNGHKINISIRVERVEQKVTIHIGAESRDGDIIVDAKQDASDLIIKVPLETDLGPENYLHTDKANDIIEIYRAISDIIEGKELIPQGSVTVPLGVVETDPNGMLRAEPAALGLLAGQDFRLCVVGKAAQLELDKRLLSDLSGYPNDIYVYVNIAEAEHLNEEQAKVVGNKHAISVRIMSDGVEIHNFEGSILISFEYKTGAGCIGINVFCAREDGSVQNMHASYDGTTASFTTDHLSIYFVEEIYARSPPSLVMLVSLFATVGVSSVLILFGYRRGDYE